MGLELRSLRQSASAGGASGDAEALLAELEFLARSAGAEVVATVLQNRDRPEAATLIGKGKADEVREMVRAGHAGGCIFDRELTPTQLRNLEKILDCKVIDRTQLILDIFAARARTKEGQLQVELAQLNYLLPRLAGRGTQMSRLGGGIGTRGPGETQLETDRRKIRARIRKIEADIGKVRSTRGVQRKYRVSVPLVTVALAGYTNAGKSTLFNRLTGAAVLADARMFATLDPTVRALVLPSHRRILLSDTVGFIRNLPTTLVDAFRATLEEVNESALILHVVDASSDEAGPHIHHVEEVLGEIGAGTTPRVLVLNKADRLGPDREHIRQRLLGEGSWDGQPVVFLSALTGDGIQSLLDEIDRVLPFDPVEPATFRFPLGEGQYLHMLHELGKVETTRYTEGYYEVAAVVPRSLRDRLARFLV